MQLWKSTSYQYDAMRLARTPDMKNARFSAILARQIMRRGVFSDPSTAETGRAEAAGAAAISGVIRGMDGEIQVRSGRTKALIRPSWLKAFAAVRRPRPNAERRTSLCFRCSTPHGRPRPSFRRARR
ncbi:hypothetical protein [Sphingomonas sp. G-3-2-10]|uniref:hypothetical protein n=1 Tax=Sphingomonas sp. G-3-2-10 TaxID=2728838 RepID=UPI00146C24B8|nr:hypothetical protein [Sphingomonas sp. G-3-2-10]NML07832.1 hypothetical protein [Sphingomonas sp. G-3-2-10]